MGRRKKTEETITKKRRPPARTPEGRENQLISLAYNLIEERLLNGTATSSETTAILRLGTQRARLEREKLEHEIALAAAKTESIESSMRIEEKMDEALQAMRRYQGYNDEDEEDEDVY